MISSSLSQVNDIKLSSFIANEACSVELSVSCSRGGISIGVMVCEGVCDLFIFTENDGFKLKMSFETFCGATAVGGVGDFWFFTGWGGVVLMLWLKMCSGMIGELWIFSFFFPSLVILKSVCVEMTFHANM